MVLQRFSSASRRCGSSFRNLTASTSTLSTTRILLCRLGNWSAWEGGGEGGGGCVEIITCGRMEEESEGGSQKDSVEVGGCWMCRNKNKVCSSVGE